MWAVFSRLRALSGAFAARVMAFVMARVVATELRQGAFRWDQLITLAVIVGAIWIFVQNIPALNSLAASTISTIQQKLQSIFNTGQL